MKLSKKQLNEIYADNRNRQLSLFLGACERKVVNDEWGNPRNMSLQYLSDQDIINLVDWWKKHHTEQKYTIQVLPTNHGYLNIEQNNGGIGVTSPNQILDFETHFTKQEIEQLKQRDDLAIDWNKAKIEPVEDDDNAC